MGKRKSKIGKQKQAKANRHHQGKRTGPTKSSSLGGVTLTKGISSKFQQKARSGGGGIGGSGGMGSASVIQSAIFSLNNQQQQKQKQLQLQNNGTGMSSKKTQPRKVFLSHSPFQSKESLMASASTTTTQNKYDEKADFQRQMASMEERQAAVVGQRKHALKKKSALLKEGGAVSQLVHSMQPASFAIDKTTTDLLHETVYQMQAMTGVGQQQQQQQQASSLSLSQLANEEKTPIRTNQSWAVATPFSKAISENSSHNPFAVLEDEDSDDENASASASAAAAIGRWGVPSLALAPPSFTLLPRITPTPAPTPVREMNCLYNGGLANDDGDDIDPDL